MLKRKKAQSILEYALLLAVVLLAVIYGANTVIKARAKANMDAADSILTTATDKLEAATGTTTATPTPTPE